MSAKFAKIHLSGKEAMGRAQEGSIIIERLKVWLLSFADDMVFMSKEER